MSADRVERQRPRPRDGRSAAERAVLDATERLLAERPLHELTVARILERADVSRASFYHYFASKHHVVAALLYRARESDGGTAADQPVAALAREAIRSWATHRPVVLAVVENRHAIPALAAAWRAVIDPLVVRIAARIEAERAAGAAPAGEPPELIAATLAAAIERAFHVAARGLDPRIADLEQAVEGITALTVAAVHGTGTAVAP